MRGRFLFVSMVVHALSSRAAAETLGPDRVLTERGDTYEQLGWRPKGLGDVNGDGYDDLGVPNDYQDPTSGTEDPHNYLNIYYGSAAGPTAAERLLSGSYHPYFVEPLGDYTGDGYDDVLSVEDGSLYLLPGGPDGLPSEGEPLSESVFDPWNDDIWGKGDLDGDGVAEVLMLDAWGYADSASLLLLYSSGRRWRFDCEGANPHSGTLTHLADLDGDLNGDGYADLATGNWPLCESSDPWEGRRLAVYFGGATALASTPDQVFYGAYGSTAFDDGFGYAVETGDVDGDGFSDLAASSPDEGAVYLYTGGAAGVEERWSATFDGWSGADLDLGDVNADGFSDLLVALNSDNAIAIYTGSATGLGTAPAQELASPNGIVFFSDILEVAGDLNGDGAQDVVVSDVSEGELEGWVAVYLGNGPDADGDGSADSVDCAPADPNVGTMTAEVCNGSDDDCDGSIDEDFAVLHPDADGDGFGDPAVASCSEAPGWTSVDMDCDDTDPDVHPYADESCGEVDSNCDGYVEACTEGGCGDSGCGGAHGLAFAWPAFLWRRPLRTSPAPSAGSGTPRPRRRTVRRRAPRSG